MLRHLAPLVALALAVSGPALAQGTPGPAAPAGAAASGQNVISLADAIKAAQARFAGGVLEAELESEGNRLVYEIDLAMDGAVHQATVDARSGEVVSVEEQTLTGTWHRWFEKDELRAAQAASGTLVQALAALEQQAGGQIAEASLEEENGRWLYEVEVDTAQGEREMMLDATTGQVMATDD